MAHDVPLGCAPDEYDDLISGTCSHLPKAHVNDVNFTPFKYQLSPSLPVKKDGPGKAIIVILSALIGGMVACGGVLLRYAMASRKQDAMMADHLV
ncbi:hypothetical protein OSK38_08935, partial [Escherichia coli]|nr:hypothetical protein [Escherichia coli]